MDIVGITSVLQSVGAFGVSILVIWALISERLVPKGRLEEMRQERDTLHTDLQIERARRDG